MSPLEPGKVLGMLLQLFPVTSILPVPPGLFLGFSKLSVATNLLVLQTQDNG